LQRLPIDAGARYAVTTCFRYLITVVGLVLAFRTVGIEWSQYQWLVAAAGVGLGFGLQEIFANFVSGLIVLMERPVRVGDVVTVDGVSGVVSRIRMRATTVTNWDRQEFIVPNKEFVTGRLLNWTLSNAINRIVINVGVAYGTDTDSTRELLLHIARDNPMVLDDPAPLATFEGFGDSTLNFVLRCYLGQVDNRLEAIHAVHSEIQRRFAAAGIEIAFPQRDIHIRSGIRPVEIHGGEVTR
jgi:potassium efflux system protein